jgi:hypothetical protein
MSPMPPSLLHHPGDAFSLICEFAEPIPPAQRDRFVRRVQALLTGDEILSPGKIAEACQKVQIEFRIAPEISEPPTMRPTRRQEPRGPFRRRA